MPSNDAVTWRVECETGGDYSGFHHITSSTVIQDLCYGKLVLTIIKNIQDTIKVRYDNKRIKWTEYCATKICRYSCQSSFQIRQRYNYLNLSICYMIKTRSLNIDITISKHASLPHVWCLINRFWRLWANSWARSPNNIPALRRGYCAMKQTQGSIGEQSQTSIIFSWLVGVGISEHNDGYLGQGW